jgi:molybdate transport system substrate-binding protein
MTKRKPFTLLLFALLLLFPQGVSADDVHLSVAASLTDAARKLADQFTAAHPDTHIHLNLGSSGALARQIEQGAPADLFISANTRWMDYLVEKNQIEASRVRVLTENRLVFVGSENNTVTAMADLSGLSRIALGSPQSVPAGQYAMEAMTAAGIYQDLLSSKTLVMTKDVRQALMYADRGETDGAFVYVTDALLAKTAKIRFTVPSDLHGPIVYPMGLTVKGVEKAGAVAFYDYLTGPEARSVLTSFGFFPPSGKTP